MNHNNFHNHLISLFLILAEPDVLKEVKQKLDLGSVKFEVTNYDPTQLYINSLHHSFIHNVNIELFCSGPLRQGSISEKGTQISHHSYQENISSQLSSCQISAQCRFLELEVSREDSWK